jgi:hypothetical protein
MANDSKTTFDHQPSFEQARRRALARLRSGMELRWSPARSRDELHRKFGDGAVDSTDAQRPLDARHPDGSIGDERE